MEQPGGYSKSYVSSIHDPLKARAAVFCAGDEVVAFAGLDTCGISSRRLVQRVRDEVERRCGIPGSHVMLVASHTHAGGPLLTGRPDDGFDGAFEFVRNLYYEHSSNVDAAYEEWVTGQVIMAICEAHCNLREAKLSIGSGFEDKVAFNRRFRMKNGRVYTHPGKGNPDIIEPAGPIDPEVGVLAAWTPEGDLLGCVVNYACHCTTMGGSTTADYVFFLEQTIQRAMGCDATVVFLNGACGDVTQVDNQSPREFEVGEKWARFVGGRIGAEAIKVMLSAEPGDHSPIAAKSRLVHIKRRAPGIMRVENSRRIVEKGLRTGDIDTVEWTFAKEILLVDYMAKTSPEAEVEIQAMQIGESLFIANPAEFFCELGLAIKRQSHFPNTFIVGLANGCVGYVPTEDAFAPTGGGYETVLDTASNLEVQAGNIIVNASLELAGEFCPGVSPSVQDASSTNHPLGRGIPWGYGVLGPDIE